MEMKNSHILEIIIIETQLYINFQIIYKFIK